MWWYNTHASFEVHTSDCVSNLFHGYPHKFDAAAAAIFVNKRKSKKREKKTKINNWMDSSVCLVSVCVRRESAVRSQSHHQKEKNNKK